MIKLEKLDESLKDKHKAWCENNIKQSLINKIEKIEDGEEKELFTEFQNKFDELIVGENLPELILFFKKFNFDKFKKEVKKIFNYDKFVNLERKNNQKWNRHIFLYDRNIKTCPYCNRQYITNYLDYKSTADLDHFYSQDEYPYLALNIYNFIPSCQICNRNFKRNNDLKDGIYPIKESFDNKAVFKLEFQNNNWLIPKSINDFTIKLDNINGCTKIEKNIDIFKLNEVYKNSHNDYIKNMLDTFEKYPDEYLKKIDSLIKYESIKDLVLKPYMFKIENNEPLGKLTKDILINYGIIKEEE